MTIIMNQLLFVVSCFFWFVIVTGRMTCDPAEENKNHTISLTLPSRRDHNKIRIDSMYQRIATCDQTSKICTNANNDPLNFTITESEDNFTVTIIIYNVTRKLGIAEQVWFMAFYEDSVMNSKNKCNLTVFARPEDIRCIHNFFSDRVFVTCIAHKIYPKGICLFRTSSNNTDTQEVTTETSNIKIQENPDYFTSSCTIDLPLSPRQSVMFHVQVTFYPNVTNHESNIQYGMQALHNISIGPPKLLNTEEYTKQNSISRNIQDIVSVQINVECVPRPKSYRLIKSNITEFKFDNIINGRAVSDRYVITFTADEASYETLTLKFTIVELNDFTHYFLVINNGISPELSYTFYIKEELKSNSNTIILAVSLVTAFLVLTLLCVCNVWCWFKRKDICLGGYSLNTSNVLEDGSIEERQAGGNESNTSPSADEYAVVNKSGAVRKVNYDVLDRL